MIPLVHIDLLPVMDEHLAHAENEFRGRFR